MVVWQRLSNNEPGGTPLAIFQVFEKSTIKSISDPPRDRRFIKLKSRLEFLLTNLLLTPFNEGTHGPDDFADLRLDGRVDTDGY